MAQHAEGYGGEAVEDHDEGDPDAPGWEVEMIDVVGEEADYDVVYGCEEHARGQSVI